MQYSTKYNRFIATIIMALSLSTSMATNESEEIKTSKLKQKVESQRIKRDSIRATKRVWTSILGGPSYTPEASLGVAAAALMSFQIGEENTTTQRSYIPIGVNASLNGTIIVAGSGALFLDENRFRIYTNYGFRNEPSNFYGVGFDQIEGVERGSQTTEFNKTNIYLNSRLVYEVYPDLFMGGLIDINYSNSKDLNPLMSQNEYINLYQLEYTNIGLGAIIQYDTRDNIATPTSGLLLSLSAKAFARSLGGSYNYQLIDLEYRQFKTLFRRATLAWTARSQLSYGDVPFTELPTFGSPFDLRGYYWGQYRDRSMGYGIAEFRYMFGSEGDRRIRSKLGYVVWVGAGTLGDNPSEWTRWKMNYGVGIRAQIQPDKNFRLDFGKGVNGDGVMIYFNMTEAF